MSNLTENYNLIKPNSEDYYDIRDFNENMDTIDAQLAQAETRLAAVDTQLTQAEESLAAINEKIGSPNDSGKNTLFGCMNGTPTSVIKSIQHITYTLVKFSTGTSISISTVDPSKCIVIFERLEDRFEYLSRLNYTLDAATLTVEHYNYGNSEFCDAKFGFWIVEFY